MRDLSFPSSDKRAENPAISSSCDGDAFDDGSIEASVSVHSFRERSSVPMTRGTKTESVEAEKNKELNL